MQGVRIGSQVTIGGMSLEEFCDRRKIHFSPEDRAEVDHGVRRAAYAIIDGKGATYFGIGAALARIVDVITNDQRSILTTCAPTAEVAGVQDVTDALPRLIGGDGVLDTFMQPLNTEEEQALARSAEDDDQRDKTQKAHLGNKGADCAEALMEMLDLKARIK